MSIPERAYLVYLGLGGLYQRCTLSPRVGSVSAAVTARL